MNTESGPWGQRHFELENNWYQRLSNDPQDWNSKAEHDKAKQAALDDPNVDFFDEVMPTNQPKRDVGEYVLSHGCNVPLITNNHAWQQAVDSGTAMIRSESKEDYKGQSGLLSSALIKFYEEDEYTFRRASKSDSGPVQGPLNAELDIDLRRNTIYDAFEPTVTEEYDRAIREIMLKGLRNGTVKPSVLMETVAWQAERNRQYRWNYQNYPLDIPDELYVSASRWQFIPGINLKVFRDPVIKDKYYIGSGEAAHHSWEVTEGTESPDIEAHDKQGWRRGQTAASFQYSLPAGKIVEFYEQIRTLPYFDQRQAPLMEMQYDSSGQLHFLQYLKTGQMITDPNAFELPTGRNVVTSHKVRGATGKNGENVRLYLDPRQYSRNMNGQAFFAEYNLSRGIGNQLQTLAMLSKVAVVGALSFKDNHFNSAPLYRPPVGIALWDNVGEVDERIHTVMNQIPRQLARDTVTHVDYIDTNITSNGRQATIESDWELKKDVL